MGENMGNNKELPLQMILSQSSESAIDIIAKYIDEYIQSQWQNTLQDNRDKLQKAYEEAGDMAYGTYLNLLLGPVNKQLKETGLRPVPNLPGEFDISREWGNEDESDQQRWMWSTIYDEDKAPQGTIVIQVFHDHTQFRIPRRPGILALHEWGKDNVAAALSRQSPEFAKALEFTEEYERYLQSQANEG